MATVVTIRVNEDKSSQAAEVTFQALLPTNRLVTSAESIALRKIAFYPFTQVRKKLLRSITSDQVEAAIFEFRR